MIINILAILLALLSGSSLACHIILNNEEIPFVFEETTEDHTSGTRLPGELKVVKRAKEQISIQVSDSDDNDIVSKYIRAEVKEDNVQFYLQHNKTLREYRKEAWIPSLEYEFHLLCSSKSSTPAMKTYIYMLGIKDDNLYEPEFVGSHFEGQLVYSHLKGFRTYFETPVTVVDYDYNRKHANISVSCEGEACEYFSFNASSKEMEYDRGYHISIDVKPKNLSALSVVMEDNKTLTVTLSASDGLHKSLTPAQLDIRIKLEDKPRTEMGGSQTTDAKPTTFLALMISGGVVLVVLLACSGTVAFLVMRSRKAKDLLRKLTEAEIQEFLNGNASFAASEGKRSVDVNTPIMALPYNHSFEIRRDKMRIDETTILGTGAFGIVWKGCVLYSNGESITVAVKTVKRNVGVLYFKALLSEIKIMAYIGKHPNIVSLVGACTHNIRKREVYIAVQYCANGNFHNYLKCRRDRFCNMVVDGDLQMANTMYTYSNKGCFSKSISTMDLLKWAIQIANGLQYLESLGVIHGDLATRNILLDSERTAKIGDFGLSRRLIDYSNYYYTKTSQAPLPWKWMAPESLKDLRFSKKSDMWSFGIVLWEVFSLGAGPYPGLNWDESFLERLEKGMRPIKPIFASNSMYDLMFDCWNLEPHDRPAILDVKRALENITSSALRQKSDMGYMKFAGEQSILNLIAEDEQGYLEPNDPSKKTYLDA